MSFSIESHNQLLEIYRYKASQNLHQLDQAIHVSKSTAALIKSIDHATKGLSFLLNSMGFNLQQTTVEIVMVIG